MLRGKCALITGSTTGLGLAIAERLAADGCNIVICGLADSQTVTEALTAVRRYGVRATYHAANLADPAQIADMMQSAIAAFGAVDVLVNNAVVRHFAPVEEMTTENWNESLAVNLSAVFHTTRLALPGMRQRGWGRIVNIGSIYSFTAATNRIDYVTTKTALLGFTRAVALETAGTDITCNAVCPGTLPTPAIQSRIEAIAHKENRSVEQATRDYLADRQPGGRFIAMDSVAALVAFLCGPSSRDISGAALPVDSGWSIS